MKIFDGMTYNIRGFWLGVKTPKLMMLGLIRLAAVIIQACCSYYHHNHFRKPDPCISPGDIKPYLDKTGKPVAFMAMAPSFLGTFSFSRDAVIGFFLSYFSDPFLCNHYGHHVSDYRALDIRTGKRAAKNAFLKAVFLPGQTGNPPNHSTGPFESLYHGAWLANTGRPAFHNFLLVNCRNFSRLGQYGSCSRQETLSF
jgi:hypothetical protein